MNDILEELLGEVLAATGKSRADFDKEVENLKGESPVEAMGNVLSLIMMNQEMTAEMLSSLMVQNAALQDQVNELQGGQANA